MPDSKLDWALSYAARGWKVFPLFYVTKDGTCSCKGRTCNRTGKHPINPGGCLNASSEEKQIREWWTRTPHANIGLATGRAGLVVMDVDDSDVIKDGKVIRRKQGPKNLAELIHTYKDTPFPENTITVKTGSGGRHYYFLSVHEIPNSQDKVAPDVDIRGQGGYVILPPSNHKSGGKYEWVNGPDSALADMPQWLEARAMASKIDIGKDKLDANVIEDAKRKDEPKKLTPTQLVKLLDYIPADCDRDTWWKIGAALKKELGEKGYQAWDDWSRKAPDKYDAKVMEAQWRSFEDTKGITGGTIDYFARQNGFRGFDIEAADAPEIKEEWIFAVGIKRFVDLKRLFELDREQFDAAFARYFQRGRPSEHVLKNPNFKIVDSVTYWPERPLYVTEYGFEKLNYWRQSGITPMPGDVTPFLNHMQYLFKPEEAKILLQYMAYQVQHPGEKVHWAVLMEGEQGNGKSYFGTVLRLILGKHNVKMVHNDQLQETFTAWQRNTQFIVVEEMMARGRLELMNKLKPMITEEWCTIREMYRPAYEQPNRFNFLFFSNHKDSIIIDNTDRRYCILKTEAPPHPDRNSYYAPLFEWTRSNGPALLDYLLHYDLNDFLPKAHAPMTAGKVDLIRQSMLPLDQFIWEHTEAKEWPFRLDLVTPSSLVEHLVKFNLRANPKEIGNAFTRLGFQQLGKLRGEGDRINLWSVRAHDVYADMDNEQLRRVYQAQGNGGGPENVPMATIDALLPNPLRNDKPM